MDFILMTPVYQGVDGITCLCVEKAHQAGLKFLWVPGTWGKGDALICRTRSVMTTTFMEFVESNHMIFLDSDIVFMPEQLKALNDHQKRGYDIIGGVYPVRSGTDWSHYFEGGIAPKGLGVHEIRFLSTGFMGISKYALQKIVKEYKYPDGTPMPLLHPNTEGYRSYPFFESKWAHQNQPDNDGTLDYWLSEDWDFCEKARQIGVKIYADTSIQLGHWREHLFTGKDVKQVQYYKVLYQGTDHQKDLMQKIDEDLAEFLSQPIRVFTVNGILID